VADSAEPRGYSAHLIGYVVAYTVPSVADLRAKPYGGPIVPGVWCEPELYQPDRREIVQA